MGEEAPRRRTGADDLPPKQFPRSLGEVYLPRYVSGQVYSVSGGFHGTIER